MIGPTCSHIPAALVICRGQKQIADYGLIGNETRPTYRQITTTAEIMTKFDLRKFTDPDWLRTITPDRLVAFLDVWRPYLAGRGFQLPPLGTKSVDCEALASVLMAPDASTPPAMVDALYFVHETCSSEDMDELHDRILRKGLPIPNDPDAGPADFAIDVWLVDRDTIIEHHAEALARRQQSFDYYSGLHGAQTTFPTVTAAIKGQIEAALDDWFVMHKRGRGSRLFVFRHPPTVWVLVRHGEPMRREAAHKDDGSADAQFYRPQKHDVLVYDQTNDEIGVSGTTKGEKLLYLRVLGLFLFGDESYFLHKPKYSLKPLVDLGATSLKCRDILGLESIRLVEYRQYWGGQHKETEVRRAEDIFGALATRKADQMMSGNPSAAVFKVKFTDSEKERRVVIRVPSSARYERNEDCEIIERWMQARGFIITRDVREGDDDDADDARNVSTTMRQPVVEIRL